MLKKEKLIELFNKNRVNGADESNAKQTKSNNNNSNNNNGTVEKLSMLAVSALYALIGIIKVFLSGSWFYFIINLKLMVDRSKAY